MLQKQYKVHKDPDQADSPGSPATPKGLTLADGRQIKSAMKTYTGLRPWESEAERMDGEVRGTKKKVRIQSRDNVTHLYDLSRSQLSEENEEEVDNEVHYPDGDDLGGKELFSQKKAVLKMSLKGSVLAIIAIVGWAFTSSWLIFLNRDIMRDKGFPFPLMLPAVSQLGCSLLAWLAGGLGFVSVRRPLPVREYLNRLFPLAFAVVMSMFLGNYAYLGLSLAFLNMLKAFTPAATLLVSAIAGMESLTPVGLLSTVLIALGTGVATAQESSHNASFHLPSFISFTTSIGFEAARVVIAAKLLGRLEKPFNPVEMMAHVGPCVFLMLAIASIAVEGGPLLTILGVGGLFRIWTDLLLVAVLSFLVNATSYYAIMYTSSTTFKVAGCFKNAAVVWWAMVQGDQVTVTQLYGFALATLGFLLYTWWTASGHPNNKGKKE